MPPQCRLHEGYGDAGGFRKAGVFASSSVVEADDFGAGVSSSIQALSSAFFRPNVLFAPLPDKPDRADTMRLLVATAGAYGLGALLFAEHPRAGLGLESTINLWVRPLGADWEDGDRDPNVDLALLVSYVLRRNWQADLNFITVVESDLEAAEQRVRHRELRQVSRIRGTSVVAVGDFATHVADRPADLNVFGMPRAFDFDACRSLMLTGRTSAVFVQGSGTENALA